MDKKSIIVYVDLGRPSSVMSNITYNQGKKFNAYTEIQAGRTPFLNFNDIIDCMGMGPATELIQAVKNGEKYDK